MGKFGNHYRGSWWLENFREAPKSFEEFEKKDKTISMYTRSVILH